MTTITIDTNDYAQTAFADEFSVQGLLHSVSAGVYVTSSVEVVSAMTAVGATAV